MYLELLVTADELQSIVISNPNMLVSSIDCWESDLLGQTEFHISIQVVPSNGLEDISVYWN